MRIRCNIMTPVGEFLVVFKDMDEAMEKIGSETHFTGPISEVFIIPMDVQKNSVFMITQD